MLTILPGQAEFLGNMYAFGAMLSFTIAHVSVIRLRASQPDFPRPYRGPGNVRIGDYDLPLFALVGGLGTAAAFVVVTALHPAVAIAGTGWLILGVIVYMLYRRSLGLDLTSTHKVAIPQPVVDHEAEYDSVLVHVGDDSYDPQTIATAARLAARKQRGIHVLVTITVPNSLPDRRAGAGRGGRRAVDHRAGAGAGRAARDRPRGEGPRGPGGPAHHRGGRRHARRRGRHDASAAHRRRVAVRQDARDGAERAPVPGDHRDDAAREAQAAAHREGEGLMLLATRVLSGVMVAIGVLLLLQTLTRGGGPLATGVVFGVLFILAGAGRLWAERRR